MDNTSPDPILNAGTLNSPTYQLLSLKWSTYKYFSFLSYIIHKFSHHKNSDYFLIISYIET